MRFTDDTPRFTIATSPPNAGVWITMEYMRDADSPGTAGAPGSGRRTRDLLTYEQFGRRFFEVAVTEARVGAVLGSIAGEDFEVGPIPSGPRGIAKVWASVSIDEPRVIREVGDLITFTVKLPLFIGVTVDLKVDRVRYDVDGVITLPLTARAAAPLELHIDVEPPRARDVFVGVASRNTRGEVIRVVAGVDREIRRFIADYVAGEIERPEVRKARIIDVEAELGKVFESLSG